MSKSPTILVLPRNTKETRLHENDVHFQFSILPLALLESDVAALPANRVEARFECYPNEHVNLLKGIDWILTQEVDALNLSVGPRSGVFQESDPLQVATRTAYERGVLVVVAAGNRGPAEGTLRALALAPWVVSVGATDAEERLLNNSSRGTSSGPTPTVVSDGTLLALPMPPKPGWAKFEPSTSFAAPRVTQAGVWILKCLELLCADIRQHRTNSWSVMSAPIRLPVVGIADTGVPDREYLAGHSPLAQQIFDAGEEHVRVSHSNQERDWIGTVLDILNGHDPAHGYAVSPAIVKRALQLAARPLTAYGVHEVGAGFVDVRIVEQYLSSFTPSKFVDLFCPAARTPAIDEAIRMLDSRVGPLWSPIKIKLFGDFFVGGIRMVVVKVVE